MKYAIRQLIKSPGFTVVALLTLALGIGVNTTAFTVLNRLMLQSLPFREPERLVQVWATIQQNPFIPQAPGDYFDEREHNTVFEAMTAYVPGARASLAEPGQPPAQYGAIAVTANFFQVFGIRPQLGRVFTEDEEKRFEPLAVVSNAFWKEHYHSDPKILGRTAKLNSRVHTIVGVMPPSLDDATLFQGATPGFWTLDRTRSNLTLRGNGWYTVTARLKPGVTLAQAQAEMIALGKAMERDNPKTNQGRGLSVVPYPSSIMMGTGAQLTWLVLALSGMVLLIACVNLANLQLVRTVRRSQEIGVRLALGCPRGALIRMFLLESILVSVGGGALGLLLAKWSNSYVARFFEIDMPLDYRVLGFTFAVSLLTGAIFGTVPAWIASRVNVNDSLKTGGRGATSDRSRHWLRQGLVVVELVLALTLLAGAGFFVSGLNQLTHRELGWKGDHVLIGFIELDHDTYGEMGDNRSLVFGERMVEQLERMPGIEAAELSMGSPAGGMGGAPFRIEGQPVPQPGQEVYAGSTPVSPQFFKVYGIDLVDGRNFRDTDRPGAPRVVIINQSMAHKFWPGESALGKRIGGIDPANPEWAEIVGVMKDFKGAADFYNPGQSPYTFVTPWAQRTHRFITFNILTAADPEAYKETVRKAIGLLAPDIAPSMLLTVKEMMASEVAYFAFLRRILVQISVLGLLLAAVGIYGVVANLASERTKEIGIRMALGAQPRSIVWLFLKNGIQLAAIGTVIGLAASFGLLTLLTKMLPMLPGRDPWIVVGVAIILVTVALIACWLPSHRTAKINPIIALAE